MTGEIPRRGLLDTNVVIHLGDLDGVLLPMELVISSVTLAELSAGPHHTGDPVERARRLAVLQHTEAIFEPLPFDAAAARSYGIVAAAVLTAGRKPRRRVADLMIASIALANRLPLYTTNPHDFAGLERLLKVIEVPRPVVADAPRT